MEFKIDSPFVKQLQIGRSQQLYDELTFAFSRTDSKVLRDWGVRSASRLVHLGTRRVGGIAQVVIRGANFGAKEIADLYQALRTNCLGAHIGQRTASAIDSSLIAAHESGQLFQAIGRQLMLDPAGSAPKVLGVFLGFNLGSGGFDGNGGIPDLDLLAGIGYHRSPLTHSIVAGILAEGLILAAVDLASQIHRCLPHDHDPMWDSLARVGRPFAESASISLSAGIAWHLLIDAGMQPAPYHDLPIPLPEEAHQALFATNSLAEGIDAATRSEKIVQLPTHLDHQGNDQQSTGEMVVERIVQTVKQASDELRETFSKWLH